MLWKDAATPVASRETGGGLQANARRHAALPDLACGPGRIAFSRDATGELVVLPLHPSMEIDVREHAFLLGSHTIEYSFVRIKGLANILHGGDGMYLDRFVTQGEQGLLILHGFGDVFEKTLEPGEKIMIEPGGFLYKDSSVQMDAIKLETSRPGCSAACGWPR